MRGNDPSLKEMVQRIWCLLSAPDRVEPITYSEVKVKCTFMEDYFEGEKTFFFISFKDGLKVQLEVLRGICGACNGRYFRSLCLVKDAGFNILGYNPSPPTIY